MYNGYFDIEFTCKIPKQGFEWKDDDSFELNPKRNTGTVDKQYDAEAYDDFRRLAKYKLTKTTMKIHKEEIIRFADRWGSLFSNKTEFHAEHEFMIAVTLYQNLVRNIKDEVLPKQPKKYIPPMNLTFGWDSKGNKMLPIYQPLCLWDAIRFTMIFSGTDMKEVSKICKRKACGNSFRTSKGNKGHCSPYCSKQRYEEEVRGPRRRQKANSERR